MSRHEHDDALGCGLAILVGAVMLVIALVVGCTDEPAARRALEANGFTDIVITGWEPAKCGDDWNSTGFTAKNPQGREVAGVVCTGLIAKNSTVRFD